MPEEITRIVVVPTRQGIGSLKCALEMATRYHRDLRCETPVLLLIPRKESGTTLEPVVGKVALQELLKGKGVTINECPARLATPRTFIDYNDAEVVVVVFASDSFIDTVDHLLSARAIIASPEFEDDISGWLRRWSPDMEASYIGDDAY